MVRRIPTKVERRFGKRVMHDEVIRVEPLPHQTKALDSTARIIVLTAGLGGGKTWTLFWWALQAAFVNYPHRVALFEPTFPMVKNVLVPTAKLVCDQNKIPHKWVPSNREFHAKVNGRHLTMTFGGASNPDHTKGPNLANAGIDEAGQVKDDSITHILKRVRLGDATMLQSMLGGTPEGMMGKFYEHAEGVGKLGRLYKQRLASGYTERIIASSFDNPNLDEEYLKQELSDFTEAESLMYTGGLFVPHSGRAYGNFVGPAAGQSTSRHVYPVDPFTGGQLIMGADFNVTPMCWVLGVWRFGVIHWFKEYRFENTVTFEVANEVSLDLAKMLTKNGHAPSKYKAAARVQVYCDASGSNRSTTSWETNVDHLRAAGFDVRLEEGEGNPRIADRQNTVNYAFSRDNMAFDPRCSNAVQSFQSQGRDAHGLPDKTEGFDHFTDAVGYAAWKLYPKPKPRGNNGIGRKYT